jgi:hypothetical protein
VAPIATAGCALANTPFRSVAYSIKGTFARTTCAAGLVGDYPLISIAAGEFGSTISQLDADAKAKAYAASIDTQAYANTNGACNTIGVYNPGVIPSGRWWLRVVLSNVSEMGISGISLDQFLSSPSAGYRPGNLWFNDISLQANQTDVFNQAPDRNDRHYPVLGTGTYQFNAYNSGVGDATATRKVRFFRNGLQVGGNLPATGFYQVLNFPAAPANGDRWYVIYD